MKFLIKNACLENIDTVELNTMEDLKKLSTDYGAWLEVDFYDVTCCGDPEMRKKLGPASCDGVITFYEVFKNMK